MTTPTNPELLTAYIADHWQPSFLGLTFGPNTQNAGFTSIQVAGTHAQFVAAVATLKACRGSLKGAEKASYTRCIKNLAGAIVGTESFTSHAARSARFVELCE